MKPIPLSRPALGAAELKAVREVLRSGWVVHGPKNKELETRIADYFGVRHCVTVNSGASALHLALLALGIRGEVLLPSFTMSATANAVVTAGAKPVFCDVDERTGNLDPAKLSSRITRRTQAILPVHYAGQCGDMDAIMAIARRHHLRVIEDSAETIGGRWRGRLAGTFGDVGCFSFWASKNITTGEGGAIITDNAKLARTIRALASHGILSSTAERQRRRTPWRRDAVLPGYNFRMSNIAAAIGVEQFKRLDSLNALRRRRARELGRALAGIPSLTLLGGLPGAEHVYQMFVVRVPAHRRNRIVRACRAAGVEASVHFDPPVHLQTFYRKRYGRVSLPITEKLAKEVITLPIFPTMTAAEVSRVGEVVRTAFQL